MNLLLGIGLLLTIGYVSGWFLTKIGLPKIIGYIITGILFSPNTFDYFEPSFIETTQPLMQICLAYIAFEVGGELSIPKLKQHGKEIILITLLETLFPLILVSLTIFFILNLTPLGRPFSTSSHYIIALILGALACPTAPAATIAVMREYKAKGKVTETIMGIVALDDAIGIIYFSFALAGATLISGTEGTSIGASIIGSFSEIAISIIIGFLMSQVLIWLGNILKINSEGKWIVIISSSIILCLGISIYFETDEILSCMVMGMVTVNSSKKRKQIFRVLERYTEDLIFLFFFLLSGIHLNVSSIPEALPFILTYVIVRFTGKYLGVYVGARLAKAEDKVKKYTAGGLLPQAGIVIGLVLSIYHHPMFESTAELMLTTIMGAAVVHELFGPISAKYSLKKAGEIK